MEIERLSFLVTPKDRVEDFVKADKSIWNPWLQQQKGFIQKHYQRYPTGRVDIRIFWQSRADWEAAAQSPQLPALESKLRAEFLGTYQKLS